MFTKFSAKTFLDNRSFSYIQDSEIILNLTERMLQIPFLEMYHLSYVASRTLDPRADLDDWLWESGILGPDCCPLTDSRLVTFEDTTVLLHQVLTRWKHARKHEAFSENKALLIVYCNIHRGFCEKNVRISGKNQLVQSLFLNISMKAFYMALYQMAQNSPISASAPAFKRIYSGMTQAMPEAARMTIGQFLGVLTDECLSPKSEWSEAERKKARDGEWLAELFFSDTFFLLAKRDKITYKSVLKKLIAENTDDEKETAI